MERQHTGPEAHPHERPDREADQTGNVDEPSTEAEIEPGINQDQTSAESFSSEPSDEVSPE